MRFMYCALLKLFFKTRGSYPPHIKEQLAITKPTQNIHSSGCHGNTRTTAPPEQPATSPGLIETTVFTLP